MTSILEGAATNSSGRSPRLRTRSPRPQRVRSCSMARSSAALIFYGVLNGFFHHNLWGNAGAGGAIQVTLVSNALPLPADQPQSKCSIHRNPQPSARRAHTQSQAGRGRNCNSYRRQAVKPQKQAQNVPKTQPHQPQPKQDNRAQFGEQSGSLDGPVDYRADFVGRCAGQRCQWRFRQPFPLVRGWHQTEGESKLDSRPGGPAHTQRRRGADLLQGQPAGRASQFQGEHGQRQPHARPFLPVGNSACRYISATCPGNPTINGST